MISERPRDTFKLPPAKFDAISSPSRTKSPMGMNKHFNAQELTKSLQRSYSIESMDSNTDRIVVSFNLEGITNNYKIWNHLAVRKQMSSIPFLNVTHKPSTLKNKNEITDKLISHISSIFITCVNKWLMLNCCWCMAVFKTVWLCANRWLKLNRMICIGWRYLKSFGCEEK